MEEVIEACEIKILRCFSCNISNTVIVAVALLKFE